MSGAAALLHDREEAGRRLGERLRHHQGRPGALVLGLPRGGTLVAAEVARVLDLPIETWVARKISAPGHPEFGVGAVSHLDTLVWDLASLAALGLEPSDLAEEVEVQREELRRRLVVYRHEPRPPHVEGRCVILVDDGLATGMTAQAALQSLRASGATSLVAAVPVAPRSAVETLRGVADEVVVLETPRAFEGVGQWYHDFHQATDREVLDAIASVRRSAS